MKSKLLIVIGILIISFGVGKTQDYNPFVQNGSITPAPLLPLQYNGTGELAFEVGNSGVDDMPLVTNQEMTLVISLSNGVPNDPDPLNALGGTAFGWFDWSYNETTRTYTATQNQLIEGSSNGTITIQYEVTRNTSSSSPANGFNVNLQPPPYTNGPNDTDDDADSDYTFVEAEDYGDSPLSYGEAVHTINVIQTNGSYTQYVFLGDTVDQEPANQPSADGLGDDNADEDDEDGINSFPSFIQGTQVTIPISLNSKDNSQGFLRAWIDWNQDGDFLDASEEVLNFHAFNTVSTYNLIVDVPPDAVAGFTFARFRAGSITGNSPAGPDTYGEVEDYEIEIIDGESSLSVIKSETSAGTAVGDVISYEITVENTGNNPVSDIDLTDDNATILTGTNPISVLDPGEVEIFTAEHVITQDDIDNGFVSNTAVATGDSPGGTDDVTDDSDTGTDSGGNTITDPETVETPNSLDPADTNGDPTDDPTITELLQTPSIELVKTGTLNDGGDGVDAGDEIDYEFTVTNTGNTTLYDIVLTDTDLTSGPTALSPLTDEDGDGTADDLAVGASATSTGSYTLTQADVDAGEYVNTAEVTGDDPEGTPVTDDDTDTQTLTRTPELTVTKNETSRSYVVGEFVTYDIIVTNTGNVTVDNIDVVDDNATILTGNPVGTLVPGASATLTAEHEVVQADVDAGFVANSATANGDSPTGTDDVADISDTGTDTDGNTIIDNELVETSNTLDPADTNGDSTDDPTVTPIDPPDVTPVITANPNVMNGPTDFNLFVEVTELNNINTNGSIIVRIPKDTRWTLTVPFDPTLTELGGVDLDNASWSYSEETNNHVFTSTEVIVGGDFSTFGFQASWDAGATQGVFTITSQIEEGSGSENRIDNNVDAEKIDYFID